MKKRVKVPAKIKAQLQQEIYSQCPFDGNLDVSCFEIHHIDENPGNNEPNNLILICPTCHSKIEKGEIKHEEVLNVKRELQGRTGYIELVSVTVDSKNCSWEPSLTHDYAFFDKESVKSPYPILNFTLVNHLLKTIVLKTIEVRVKRLPRGLGGLFDNQPTILKPLVKYFIPLSLRRAFNSVNLEQPIEVPSKRAFMFQIELAEGETAEQTYQIEGRLALYFSFIFSTRIKYDLPPVCLNCNHENEGLRIVTLA